MSLSTAERERYRRHLALREIGEAGQEKLKAARVLPRAVSVAAPEV